MRVPLSALLRPDLPPPSSFVVSTAPHRAKLDQNESPWPLPAPLVARIDAALHAFAWHRYPQPHEYLDVKASFARAIGHAPETVALTVGGDQAIAGAFMAAGGPGRSARIFEPTYPMFAHYARATHTEYERVVLGPDFELAAQGLGGPVDLMCFVSPNNPTGHALPRALLRAALRAPQLVLVDEAYQDFAQESCEDLLPAHENLLIARSLSKVGLAGVRLGYLLGAPLVINAIERLLLAPYHLSAFALAAASCMDALMPVIAERVLITRAARERVFEALGALGVRAYPSQGNFILFDAADPAPLHARLLAAGVRVRDVSALPGLSAHLRVTVGTPEENALFLEVLAQSLP